MYRGPMASRATFFVLSCCGVLACGADDVTPSPDPVSSSGPTSGVGGSVTTGVGGGDGAGGSSIGAPPEVVTSSCDVESGGYVWAVADFPGKSAAELRLIGVETDIPSSEAPPPGLTRRLHGFAYVGDGLAAYPCGLVGSPSFTEVTFIVPEP